MQSLTSSMSDRPSLYALHLAEAATTLARLEAEAAQKLALSNSPHH